MRAPPQGRSAIGAGTLLGRDSGGNGVGDARNLPDRLADTADRVDCAAGFGLDGADPVGDIPGYLGGLLGQRLDLAGDDRESLARLAGALRLDRGVERRIVPCKNYPVSV